MHWLASNKTLLEGDAHKGASNQVLGVRECVLGDLQREAACVNLFYELD